MLQPGRTAAAMACWVLLQVAAEAALLRGRAPPTGARRAGHARALASPLEQAQAQELELEWLERERGHSIEHYLRPDLDLDDARRRLRAGEVVVLRDAFRSAFAEATHKALCAPDFPWRLSEAFFDDGYAFHHSNVHDRGQWPARLNSTYQVFADEGTRRWVGELAGRDCGGECPLGSPSRYDAGDYSLPHSDWVGQRAVAYVWHLSKEWRPEWGGGLYWAGRPQSQALYPPTFNTLVLFGVTPTSAHFVTPVSSRARGLRLSFNGWWLSRWRPSRLDFELERALAAAVAAARGADGGQACAPHGGHVPMLTHAQVEAVGDLLEEEGRRHDGGHAEAGSAAAAEAERRRRLHARVSALHGELMDELVRSCGTSVLLRQRVLP